MALRLLTCLGLLAQPIDLLIKRRDVVGLLMLVAIFVAIGVLRLPLAAVLLVAIPLSIAITYAMRDKEAA